MADGKTSEGSLAPWRSQLDDHAPTVTCTIRCTLIYAKHHPIGVQIMAFWKNCTIRTHDQMMSAATTAKTWAEDAMTSEPRCVGCAACG